MRTFILAAGFGTRVRALHPDIPKCLIPVRGKPFLLWQMRYVMDQGFKDFVLCIGYRKEQIMDYFKDGKDLGVSIRYSVEDTPQGTGTTLGAARRFFDEASLVLNGDTYLPIDYRSFVETHGRSAAEEGALASLALSPVSKTAESGQVILEGNRITAFAPKQQVGNEGTLANAGAYVLESAVMDRIPQNGPCSLEHDVFPRLASEGHLYGVRALRGFIDMGSPQGLAELENVLS